MKTENSTLQKWPIPFAIVVGLALAIRPVDHQYIIPLWDFAAILREWGILEFGKIVLAAALLYFGPNIWILVFAIIEFVALWVAQYSVVGAFFPQSILNGLLLLAVFKLGRQRVRDFSVKAFSLIFLLAALQKINPSYLAGTEFLSRQGFMGISNYFFGPLPRVMAERILPVLSIAIELVIAVGLLWRPTFFSQVATIFILLLALVHPPVLFVYMTALFFLILIDSDLHDSLLNKKLTPYISNPFFWATAASIVAFLPSIFSVSVFTYFLKTWPITLALLSIHLILLKGKFQLKNDPPSVWRLSAFFTPQDKAIKALLVAMILLFSANKMNLAPTPIGFSMFSGVKHSLARHKLDIVDLATCRLISGRLGVFGYTDVALQTNESHCTLSTPTSSGRLAAMRQFCRDFPNLRFRIYEHGSENSIEGDCTAKDGRL